MNGQIDLERYPLDRLDSAEGEALIASCKADLDATGMFSLDGFLTPGAVDEAVRNISPVMENASFTHARTHNIYFTNDIPGLAPDHPARAEFQTVNHTVCADQIPGSPVITAYEYPPLADFLARVMDKPRLYPMRDRLARVNVMRYREGEALNWHFDRSEFTTTLLLEGPEAGGAFEYVRNLRADDDPRYDDVARLLAGDWPVDAVHLSPGTLNVFRGKNTAHRVSPVQGSRQRTIAVFSYYEREGVEFSDEERIGFYGRAA